MSDAPYILALDIASKTGIAEGRVGEAPRCYSMKFARDGDEHEDIYGRGLVWIAERLKAQRPDWVFIEAPINWGAFMGRVDPETGRVGMSTNPETTLRLIGLWGAIAGAVKAKGIAYRRARVQEVRKSFLGHGNLKGEIAKARAKAMCHALGWDVANTDESDAAAVWHWAGTIVAPRLYFPITPMLQAKIAGETDAALSARKRRRA